ncbi:MAG: M28 family peptidase [Cocleimonas sp.]|nr:M28 family peptidase [Cocleimonas sp.]
MKTIRNIILAIVFLVVSAWFVTTQPIFVNAKSVSTPDVNPQLLKSHVVMLSETLPARGGFEENLNPTVEWIEKQLQHFGKSTRQSYKINDKTFYNILLDFGPPLMAGATEPEEIIIVGAHYDTAHSYPGADDNASGVAALIELARLLSKHKASLTTRIQLAFYSLEEPPYFRTEKMGSFIHASSLKEKQQKIKMMIALDMVGYFSDKKNSQSFPIPFMDKLYSDQGNFIAVVGNLSNMLTTRKVKKSMISATELLVYSINAPTLIQGIDFSDHLNFWHFGYPAVLITDTSFMRNTAYHTKQDTADRLDYMKMAEVVKGLYQVVIQ